TMTPRPCLSIDGKKPRSRRTADMRFKSSVCCQWSSVRASAPPPGAEEPPTELIRMSRPPSWPSVASMTQSAPAGVLTSAWMKWSDLPPIGPDRAVVSTTAPAEASRLTTAAPIPLVPPVTRTRLPANSAVSGVCKVAELFMAVSSCEGNRSLRSVCLMDTFGDRPCQPVEDFSVQMQCPAQIVALHHAPKPTDLIRRLQKRVIAVNGRVLFLNDVLDFAHRFGSNVLHRLSRLRH